MGSLYFFGQKLGMNSIKKGHFAIGVKRFLSPINYWRFPVFNDIRNLLRNKNRLRILDIGSLKLLAIYLAAERKDKVYATDSQDESIFSVWSTYYEDLVGSRLSVDSY